MLKIAFNFSSVLEVGTCRKDFGTTSDWATSWLQLKQIGRLVVIEDVLIIRVLDAVQCDLDFGLLVNVGWGSHTCGAGRVRDDCVNALLELWESTPSVHGVVNLVKVVLEWVKVSTLQGDDGATVFGTAVWHKVLNCGEVVVPEE